MPGKRREVDGDDVLYRLFLRVLEGDVRVSAALVDHLVQATSIWFPPELYRHMPVLLPWVVRDPKCRPHTRGGRRYPNAWGSPDLHGFLRDDNSLIKNLPRSLKITGPRSSFLEGARLGPSFVAAHVWREVHLHQLASRDSRLNSFIPNMVWLPRQVAKLSDREGGPIQAALKRLAVQIYRDVPVAAPLRNEVRTIWELLPVPKGVRGTEPPEVHFFEPTDRFFESRREGMRQVIRLLEAVIAGRRTPACTRVPSRFVAGITRVPRSRVAGVHRRVRLYCGAAIE